MDTSTVTDISNIIPLSGAVQKFPPRKFVIIESVVLVGAALLVGIALTEGASDGAGLSEGAELIDNNVSTKIDKFNYSA